MRNIARRIAAASVWSPNAFPRGITPADDTAWRFRGIFQFVLPLTDAFFAYFGIVGAIHGEAAVAHATGPVWQQIWSAILALGALGALLGVSFPKLWFVELPAKIVLVGAVGVYLYISLAWVYLDFAASASTGVVCILVLLPLWRIGDLGVVAGKRGHWFTPRAAKIRRKGER